MQTDVVVIGGSYAGLSAAMALGRSLREVVVVDAGKPCNRQTPHSHNFLTQDGETPAAIAAKAKEQVMAYPGIRWENDEVVQVELAKDLFEVVLLTGKKIMAKKIVLATGVKDIFPAIDGLAECWGITVVHCPYCHGYEFRVKKTAILANGERAFHLATLVYNLTKDLVILTNGAPDFSAQQLAQLEERNIAVVPDAVQRIIHQDGVLSELSFASGETIAFDAVYAALPFEQQPIVHALGVTGNEHGYIVVNGLQQTNVPGIYACGDNTAMMRSVANAVYSGNVTGALVNRDLAQC